MWAVELACRSERKVSEPSNKVNYQFQGVQGGAPNTSRPENRLTDKHRKELESIEGMFQVSIGWDRRAITRVPSHSDLRSALGLV